MKEWFIIYRVWILLFAIVLLGTGLRVYNLGTNSFVADEFLDINSSYGYAQTGEWKSWDFNYGIPAVQNINNARDERASVYKWQVAQVFKILPPTEVNARLVSILWGVISMFLIFFVTRYFTKSKETALIATFLFALSVSAIIFDRRLRMYAMFLPVYLALSTSLYALFEHEYRGKIQFVRSIWDRYGFNILFLIPTIVLGYLSFLTHQITLTIVPVFGVYVLIMSILLWRQGNRKNKYSILTALGLLGLLVVVVTGLWSKVSYLFVFFD
ncbi:MAG: glycosyltransferase family 39 protein, partial [Patescibacteria group bacterium]